MRVTVSVFEMNEELETAIGLAILLVSMPLSFCIVGDQRFIDEWTSMAFEDCTQHCLKNRHYCKQVSYIGNDTCLFLNSK